MRIWAGQVIYSYLEYLFYTADLQEQIIRIEEMKKYKWTNIIA
jgi:hypothetical protein